MAICASRNFSHVPKELSQTRLITKETHAELAHFPGFFNGVPASFF